METLSSTIAQSYKNGTHKCDGKFLSFTTFQNRFSVSFFVLHWIVQLFTTRTCNVASIDHWLWIYYSAIIN